MVQTFGKRVLGGIGAPGGGMSTAYAEGVNTGINQRANRQAMAAVDQNMRLAEQDQQFKIEDREEAKRQRAAAAAAAAAARARSAALAQALAGGAGVGPAPGLKIPPGKTYGPVVAVGGSIPATPPAAGTPVPQRPPLSFGLGATGQQVSEAPMNISNIEFVQGTYDTPTAAAPRVGVMDRRGAYQAARAAEPDVPLSTAESIAATTAPVRQIAGTAADRILGNITGAVTGAYGLSAATAGAAASLLGYSEFGQAQFDRAGNAFTSAEQQAGQGFFGSGTQEVPAFERGGRGTPPASAGPKNVTVQGPNGPIVLPADEMYPVGETVTPAGPAQLSFGPGLGAPQADINATTVDRVAANPVGQAQPTPNAELYIMEPGRPGRELQQAYDTREELVRQIDIYAEYGDYATVRDLTTKVNELDNSLYYLQGMQGIQELQFNSPQRLQMVLSEQLGRDIGLQPNAQGGYDVYVDGMLAMQMDTGSGENSVSYWARSILDDNFATAEAARAETYNELAYKSQLQRDEIAAQGDVNAQLALQKEILERESARIAGLTELDMMAIKRDLGLTNDDKIEFQKDETSGTVMVFRNGELEAQYGPVESVDSLGNTITSFEQKY